MAAPAGPGSGAEPQGHVEQSVFRSLFSAYPDALLLVDAAGTIVMANPTAARLLGYEAGELGGLPVDALVPEAIRPRHAAYRAAYGRAPQPRPMGTQMELVARRKDGTEVMRLVPKPDRFYTQILQDLENYRVIAYPGAAEQEGRATSPTPQGSAGGV